MKLQWNQIDWKKAEEQVNRLQIRIVKATLEQKWRLVKRLQYLMTNSLYAKAIAVKRVITNKGKKTPGIDGELWKTDKDKINAIERMDCRTTMPNLSNGYILRSLAGKKKDHWEFRLWRTEQCRHYSCWLWNRSQKQRQTGYPLDLEDTEVRRTQENTHLAY